MFPRFIKFIEWLEFLKHGQTFGYSNITFESGVGMFCTNLNAQYKVNIVR